MEHKTIKYTRCAKAWGLTLTDEFYLNYSTWRKTANRWSKLIKNYCGKGRLELLSFQKANFDGEEHTAAQFKNKMKEDHPELYDGWGYYKGKRKCEGPTRQVYQYMGERYYGYANRNKDRKLPSIVIKENKSWYFKDNDLKVDEKKKIITIKGPRGYCDIPYKYSLKLDKIPVDKKGEKKWQGGNLVVKQKCIIIAVECEKECLYDPVDILSFDMNRQTDQWLAFSDDTIITRPKEVEDLIKELQDTQEILREKEKPVSERTMRSRKRSKFRRKMQRKHKQLDKIISKIADEILDKVIENKYLLAIDIIDGTGSTHGTFGHDHLSKYLIKECENRGIPFYGINPAWTSQTCSACGHKDKKNRKNTDEFECLSCGYKSSAHSNASYNIKQKAQDLKDEGIRYGNWSSNLLLAKERKEMKKSVIIETE